MKTLSCKDMGVDCDFVAQGETADEVIKKASEHTQTAHADKIKEMTASMTSEEMNAAMMAAVKDM